MVAIVVGRNHTCENLSNPETKAEHDNNEMGKGGDEWVNASIKLFQ